MKPFFFGPSSQPLFGVHHPGEGARRRWGVLVCSPFGQEALRAHRCLRDLASRLSAVGFDVLRFDYGGCGDSAGASDSGSMSRWREDVALAAEELGEAAGTDRLALVGLRLGGALAALHASARRGVGAVVLWDPVLDGRIYLEELRATHRAWMRDHAHRDEEGERDSDQVLGFPLPGTLAAELEGLRLAPLEIPAGTRVLAVSSAGGERRPIASRAGALDQAEFPASPVWLHAEGMDRVLVPTPLLDHVTGWLEAACR